jgi:t-SNARE complex subunit (syntaxin)
MDDNKPARRIVAEKPSILSAPLADTLIADALLIIQAEMVKFKRIANTGKHLSAEEGRLLNHYIKSLTELSREQREQDKKANLDGMTTEELIALLQAKPSIDVTPKK